ncbi:transcriptional regulator [Parasphingopyxis algicola]|uniref:winged helix-turn-helix transcriptional regulator n=1 Tax=Parasphingopyxis algicola TaxID=2026624 RepID=UPI0015A05B69|nr:helix-turn-helix domain-containing protein [Parasphingopyxis algicola]QLC23691.1 transcriptional regulator [Parasphingopyxis algicola]
MKLQKETNAGRSERKRWYNDACGTAFALDLIGERWSILIIRELMFGPRRFGELRAGLPGISANILTQRLERLEENRILVKRRLPPPASAQVYELTEWGYESEPMVQMLGRWATRHPEHDPTLPLSAASIMMSFRTMIDSERAGEMDARLGFRLGEDAFVAHVHGGAIDIERGDPATGEVRVSGEATMLAAVVYGGEALADMEAQNLLTVRGDRALFERFIKLFVLPEKLPEIG